MPRSDDIRELEYQVERGNLFAHNALAEQALRANENEAIINGLVDHLVRQGLVEPDALLASVESARAETAETRELASAGVAIRVDEKPADRRENPVNCEERLPICRAVCCRLRFALSVEEVESGPLKWDLGQPYYNRQREDGYCHRIDADTRACTIYDERPCVCRAYSCAGDARIWKDFEAMELNQEWIDANLDSAELSVVEIFMSS
jgi:Fe-S-cluster containining protein